MSKRTRAVNWVLRGIFRAMCRIHLVNFDQIPKSGPLILVGNHVNFLEVPLVLSLVDNPCFTGVAKKETWDNPFFKFLFNRWGIIPIDREGIDREAFRLCIQALDEGKLLAIAPEGTRNKTGCLLQGKPGVTAIAARSRAPMMPVVFFGHENIWSNLKRLRRTDFYLVVGKPFALKLNGEGLSREVRQAVTDEIMYKIAELLPEKYRGYYRFEGEIEYRYLTPL